MKKRKMMKYAGRAYVLLKNFQPQDLNKYVPHYNELSLYQKLISVVGLLSDAVILPIVKLYFVLKDKNTPKRQKVYIMGALGYFILPLDLIPDFLPALIGFTDDIVVISFVLKLIEDNLTPELEIRAERAYRQFLCHNKKNHPTVK